VLIASQPTRGVDYRQHGIYPPAPVAQRAAGLAMVLISEDLDEVRNLSDRIAVMYEGKIMGVVERDKVSIEELGLMMAGVKVETKESISDGGIHQMCHSP